MLVVTVWEAWRRYPCSGQDGLVFHHNLFSKLLAPSFKYKVTHFVGEYAFTEENVLKKWILLIQINLIWTLDVLFTNWLNMQNEQVYEFQFSLIHVKTIVSPSHRYLLIFKHRAWHNKILHRCFSTFYFSVLLLNTEMHLHFLLHVFFQLVRKHRLWHG